MRRAVLIAVGDELLSGMRQERNCAALARELYKSGWELLAMEVVRDETPDIVRVLERWVGASDLLVLSGGLGPTHDDRTREALAEYLKSPLRSESALYDRVVARYEGWRQRTVEGVRDLQSTVPEAARGVYNPVGTALGIFFERSGTKVWSLPGVPVEFDEMVRQELGEWLRPDEGQTSVVVAGRPELEVASELSEVISDASLHVSILPSFGTVELLIRGAPDRVRAAEALSREKLKDDVLPEGCRTLQEAVLEAARRRGWTLSCAESCTGGLLGGALTEVPGSSSVFWGSAVTYSNEAKTRILGVDASLIARYGAVSGECAGAMARGARSVYGTDLAVAVTGVAGPDGGSDDRPVGTVWFALDLQDGMSSAFCRHFSGSRERVRDCSVRTALLELWRILTLNF